MTFTIKRSRHARNETVAFFRNTKSALHSYGISVREWPRWTLKQKYRSNGVFAVSAPPPPLTKYLHLFLVLKSSNLILSLIIGADTRR